MKRRNLLSCIFVVVCMVATAQTYTDGVFVLNEDWYGHNNSSMNFLHPETGTIDYYIVQANPANMQGAVIQTLGCTAQYGAIYGDKMYVIAKQDQDAGENAAAKRGGRLVVLDARTMRVLYSQPVIAELNGQSVADGRSFVGVDSDKGYVGTSNGIYVLDLQTYMLSRPIEGSENPLVAESGASSAGLGALYENQIGTMLRVQDYVLAIQQDKGILVINPMTDKIERVIQGCFSTMVQSKDGYVWAGMNDNENEAYRHYPYGSAGEEWVGNVLLRINPYTLETKRVELSCGGISQSWYAWNAGSLCAGTQDNVLYFIYNEVGASSWFATAHLYKYDIDSGVCELIYDSSSDNRYFYGAGIRVNPIDDKIYAAMYAGYVSSNYFLYYQFDKDGKLLKEFEPISGYWYPAMFVFPDNHPPVVSDFQDVVLDGAIQTIDLSGKATDADSPSAAIIKSIKQIGDKAVVDARIQNGQLILTPLKKGSTFVTVRFNSNGQCIDSTVQIRVEKPLSGIHDVAVRQVHITVSDGIMRISGMEQQSCVEIYNMQGSLVYKGVLSPGDTVSGLARNQLYLVRVDGKTYKIAF